MSCSASRAGQERPRTESGGGGSWSQHPLYTTPARSFLLVFLGLMYGGSHGR